VANFYLAFEQDLALVPVLNKVDLPAADPDAVAGQLAAAFDLEPAAALRVSARTGAGLDELLPAIVE
jgi:translation elongation factor EF-4